MTCVSAADNQTTDVVAIENDVSEEISVDDSTDEILADTDAGTFTDLNASIAGAGSELKLDKNYTYDDGKDNAELELGIKIDKDNFVIDGQGHTISGANQANIFKINGSVTLRNIIFINDNQFGHAIEGDNYAVENCTFKNLHVAIVGGNAVNCIFEHNHGAMINGSAVNCTFNNNVGNNGHAGAVTDCTVLNCNFTNNTNPQDPAGAMRGGSAENCIFINNSVIAQHSGGAIYEGSAVNCIFINNSAPGCGGAMYGGNARNCTFINNRATNGGAIYDGTAVNCNFTNNSASQSGGAMHYDGTAVNCTFTGNQANEGGALCAVNAANCTFTNNSASGPGGALVAGTAENCTFINNHAGSNGGAIHVGDKAYDINYCTFINNTAGDSGGAIYTKYEQTFSNCRYMGNSAQRGSAIYTTNRLKCVNSVFLNNKVTPGSLDVSVGDNQILEITFVGNDNYINAVYYEPYPSMEFDNVTYWNGHDEVNSDVVAPQRDAYSGVKIVVEVYDSYNDMVDNNTYVTGDDGKSSYNPSSLAYGKYTYKMYNLEDNYYSRIEVNGTFYYKENSTISINPIDNVTYNNTFTAVLAGDHLTTINVTVYDSNNNIVFTQNITETNVTISVLPVGQYTLTAINYGNDGIFESTNSTTFNIVQAPNNVTAMVEFVRDVQKMIINVVADVDGNYTVNINGTTSNVCVVDGKGSIILPLTDGVNVNVTFDNPNFDSNITVEYGSLRWVINAADAKYGVGSSMVYQVKFVDDNGNPLSNKTLTFTVNGKTYNATTDSQGIAKITLNLKTGSYNVAVSNELAAKVTKKISVLARIVENKNLVMDYDSGSFKVKAIGDDGNPIANVIVNMKINGKTFKVKTDKKGYATLKITFKPKTYTITSTYKTTTVKNTIKVKSTLKAQKAFKVKKTAKKLVLKATLKHTNGKAIAGKKITFKFKGKKYTAKTNKKGLAKITLKKKVISKLKAGKKYAIKINYKDEVVNSKLNVKK